MRPNAILLSGAANAKARPAIDVGQIEDVTGIDQVRVMHLRIGLPHLWPLPRALQEARRNTPERISLLHRIGVGMMLCQLHRRGESREGEQQSSTNCR